jgi:hypothetical protein
MWILPFFFWCRDFVLNLPRRDPHDVNRVTDHIGGSFLSLGAFRHPAIL